MVWALNSYSWTSWELAQVGIQKRGTQFGNESNKRTVLVVCTDLASAKV